MADVAVRLSDVPDGVRQALGALLLITFGIKAAIFPLFFWLPDSYPTAPAPVTAVFAGLLTKVGVYAIMRVQLLLFPESPLKDLLLFDLTPDEVDVPDDLQAATVAAGHLERGDEVDVLWAIDTDPVIDGRVRPEGVELNFIALKPGQLTLAAAGQREQRPPRIAGVIIGPQQPGVEFQTMWPPSRTGPSIGTSGPSRPSVKVSTKTVRFASVRVFGWVAMSSPRARFGFQPPETGSSRAT